MMTIGQLDRYIDRTYTLGGGDVGCCKQILAAVLTDSRQVYTYGDLISSANAGTDSGYDIGEVQRAINVLKSDHVRLLRELYRYIDDDVIYDLSLEDLQVAMLDGVLELEFRGYPDRDFKSKVYVIFCADRAVVSNEFND